MMPWRPDAGALLAFALATVAGAQEPAAPSGSTALTTPDGSRFWLLPTTGAPLVHWAIASPCGPLVDPPGAPGLAAACALASLNGTWQVGSLDPVREAAALSALDQGETDLAAAPRVDGQPPPELAARVAQLRLAAAAAADRQAFRRVLMATPVQDVQEVVQGNAAVLSLTTTPDAIARVAQLLVDRREGQALRDVRAVFDRRGAEATAEWDRDPMAPLRAEALALAFPGTVLARAGDRPPAGGCSRTLAQSTWARTQHPAQTVHVLTGNFDVAAAAAQLRAAFASTALPPPPVDPPVTPRPVTGIRRAIVPGAQHPAAVIGWCLRGTERSAELACLVRWFGDGAESWLGQQLQQRGRLQIALACRAPWPGPPGQALLLLEAEDPAGGNPALADEILALCRAGVKKAPRPGELERAHAAALAAWERATRGDAALARQFAIDLLLHGGTAALPAAPTEVPYGSLPELLQQLLDTSPVVVEWRTQ